MQIQCENCGDVLKAPLHLLGKQGNCPQCLQPVDISKENEFFEAPHEFALRMQKKGFPASTIQQKLLQINIHPIEVQQILESLKQRLSLAEQKKFGQFRSYSMQEIVFKRDFYLLISFFASIVGLLTLSFCFYLAIHSGSSISGYSRERSPLSFGIVYIPIALLILVICWKISKGTDFEMFSRLAFLASLVAWATLCFLAIINTSEHFHSFFMKFYI